MSKITNGTTKQIMHTPAFITAARLLEEESLAYNFIRAFGITLEIAVLIAEKIVKSNDTKVFQLCITASVQIRGNVVYVGNSYGDVRNKYAELIIEGPRNIPDVFNFGALHVVGHVFAHLTSNPFGPKILNKAGDCILGTDFPPNEAGSINKDISEGWLPSEKSSFKGYKTGYKEQASVDGMFANITTKAATFSKEMTKAGTVVTTKT